MNDFDQIMKLADEWYAHGQTSHSGIEEKYAALRAAVEQIVRERDAHAKASASNYAALQIAANARDRAEQERESFYMDYRMKCDEETKALHVKLERAESLQKEWAEAAHRCKERCERAERERDELRALLEEARQDVDATPGLRSHELRRRIDAALEKK